jgi:hypothetical protein
MNVATNAIEELIAVHLPLLQPMSANADQRLYPFAKFRLRVAIGSYK